MFLFNRAMLEILPQIILCYSSFFCALEGNYLFVIVRVVIALCGGNIDTTALGRVIERGLAVDGRLVRFVVRVSDRPGGIAELTKMLADMGVR